MLKSMENGVSDLSKALNVTSAYETWQAAVIVTVCGVMMTGTLAGNLLVCISVAVVRRLRTPSNLLIVSLALSDLLVAAAVMPFATAYEVMGTWVFGASVCDLWTSTDVLLCTSSILNLCAISIDRYFVITQPFDYALKRTSSRMVLMVAGVWLLSAVISMSPLLGWRSETGGGQCMVSQSVAYQLYATICAFYLPLGLMVAIYTRIYLVSRRLVLAEMRAMPAFHYSAAADTQSTASGCITPLRKDSRLAFELTPTSDGVRRSRRINSADSTETLPPRNSASSTGGYRGGVWPLLSRRLRGFGGGGGGGHRLSATKESKATKTLGVIMGAFILCWLPFFLTAIARPFCAQPLTCVPPWLNSLLLWLGYANSFLNPLIYARYNRDFRQPFRELLLCRCRGINMRMRSESYAEQYGTFAASSPAVSRSAAGWCKSALTLDSAVIYRQHEHPACSAVITSAITLNGLLSSSSYSNCANV